MPYILPQYREVLDPYIETIVEEIYTLSEGEPKKILGSVGYAIDTLFFNVWQETRYIIIAIHRGILHNIGDELCARLDCMPEHYTGIISDTLTGFSIYSFVCDLAGEIKKNSTKFEMLPGLVNYCGTKIALRLMLKIDWKKHEMYWIGYFPSLFYQLAEKFYQSNGRLYEDVQKKTNGDLPEYEMVRMLLKSQA